MREPKLLKSFRLDWESNYHDSMYYGVVSPEKILAQRRKDALEAIGRYKEFKAEYAKNTAERQELLDYFKYLESLRDGEEKNTEK